MSSDNDNLGMAGWIIHAEVSLGQYKAHLAQFDQITDQYLTKLGPEGKKLMVEVRGMSEALREAIEAICHGLKGDDPFPL